MGNVKVMLGDCDNLLDKLFELKQMMPELEGRSGVLHMENFSGETGGIIFKKNGEQPADIKQIIRNEKYFKKMC